VTSAPLAVFRNSLIKYADKTVFPDPGPPVVGFGVSIAWLGGNTSFMVRRFGMLLKHLWNPNEGL